MENKVLKSPLFYASYIVLIFLSLHGSNIYYQGNSDFMDILNKTIVKIQTAPMEIHLSQENLKFTLFMILGLSIMWLHFHFSQKTYMAGKDSGTARWATLKESKKLRDKKLENNIILTNTEMLNLKKHKLKKNHNVVVVGGSGSGKTRFFCKPNLMQLNTSFAVCDPKAELLKSTGKMFEDAGYKIKVLNLIEMQHSNTYNPFVYLREDKDVLKLINNIIKNTSPVGEKNTDGFWVRSETALLQALIYYIYYEGNEDEKNFSMLMDLLSSAEVREEDETFESKLDIVFKRLEGKDKDHIAVKQYKIFKLASGKTAKNILVSLGVRLATFNTKALRNLTLTDNIELESIGDEKTILYIVIPDFDTTYNFLVAMIYSQLFDTLYYRADFEYNGSLPIQVRIILDEFANTCHLPDFPKVISTIRSRGISAAIILQDLAQIKSMYKDDWQTIVGNCDSFLFLGGRELSTLEYISKTMGKRTINVLSYTKTKGRNRSTSINDNTKARELMTPDEIAQMPDSKCLLLIRGMRPFYSDKFKLEKHPAYSKLSENDEEAFNFRKVDYYEKDNYELVSNDVVFNNPENIEYEYYHEYDGAV